MEWEYRAIKNAVSEHQGHGFQQSSLEICCTHKATKLVIPAGPAYQTTRTVPEGAGTDVFPVVLVPQNQMSIMFLYKGAHLLDPKNQRPRILDTNSVAWRGLHGIPIVIRLDRVQKISCGTYGLQITRCLASSGNRCERHFLLHVLVLNIDGGLSRVEVLPGRRWSFGRCYVLISVARNVFKAG